MKIKINRKTFEVVKDDYCWAVHQLVKVRKGKTAGEGKRKRSTYHGNVEQLIKNLVDRSILEPEEGNSLYKSLERSIQAVREEISTSLVP